MADLLRPDLCIVGAGALGTELARHARSLGADVVLVDRGQKEPNDGPANGLRLAALQVSAARAHALRTGADFGLVSSEPKVNFKALAARLQTLAAERSVLDSDARHAALGIEIVRGTPRFAEGQVLEVGDVRIRAGATILALGAETIVPAIPGLDAVETFTLDTILDSSRKLSHLLVIGGDPAGFAMTQAFRRLGSDVTLVPQGPALTQFDPETRDVLLSHLAEEGLRVLDGGVVSAIQPRSQGIGASVTLPSGEAVALDISHILLATSRVAAFDTLNPEAAKLRAARQGVGYLTGALGQTSNRRIRLVGAAAGIEQWPHALRHGRAVVEALVLGAPRAPLGPQPEMVATEPALVQIGSALSDGKAKAGHSIHRASLAENEAALALGQGRGIAKALVDANGRIVSASLIGPGAGELGAVLALAMERGIGLDALADLSLPQPSLLSSISSLAENYRATRPVSAWTARRRALRRVLPIRG